VLFDQAAMEFVFWLTTQALSSVLIERRWIGFKCFGFFLKSEFFRMKGCKFLLAEAI
jgi:hypothetical protein